MRMHFEDKLLTLFFDYLEEVVVVKEKLNDGSKVSSKSHSKSKLDEMGSEEPAVTDSDSDEHDKYKKLASDSSFQLCRSLNAMDKEVKDKYSAYEHERWQEAKYLLAATVDEIFIYEMETVNKTWDKGKYWIDCLLEYQVNSSRNAGEEIFSNIDKLVEDKSGDPIFVVLAKLYCFSLLLGFKGRYRNTLESEKCIQKVKQRLEKFIGDKPPHRDDLFEQSKKNTGVYGKGTRIASMQPWLRAVAVALSAYFVVSSYVWLTSIDLFHSIIPKG